MHLFPVHCWSSVIGHPCRLVIFKVLGSASVLNMVFAFISGKFYSPTNTNRTSRILRHVMHLRPPLSHTYLSLLSTYRHRWNPPHKAKNPAAQMPSTEPRTTEGVPHGVNDQGERGVRESGRQIPTDCCETWCLPSSFACQRTDDVWKAVMKQCQGCWVCARPGHSPQAASLTLVVTLSLGHGLSFLKSSS